MENFLEKIKWHNQMSPMLVWTLGEPATARVESRLVYKLKAGEVSVPFDDLADLAEKTGIDTDPSEAMIDDDDFSAMLEYLMNS